jgi:hypothetical protein
VQSVFGRFKDNKRRQILRRLNIVQQILSCLNNNCVDTKATKT